MALLSQMIRTVAITGRTDSAHAWFADRQGGRWAEQQISAAFPDQRPHARAGPPADPAKTLRELTALRDRGVLTDVEFERLRAGLPAS
jgi:hypothetical protein